MIQFVSPVFTKSLSAETFQVTAEMRISVLSIGAVGGTVTLTRSALINGMDSEPIVLPDGSSVTIPALPGSVISGLTIQAAATAVLLGRI